MDGRGGMERWHTGEGRAGKLPHDTVMVHIGHCICQNP